MEAVGQRLIEEQRVVVPEEPRDRALTPRERDVLRSDRLRPAANEAAKRLYAAEDARDMARDALRTAAVNLILGAADEATVRALEDQIADAEREVRRWTAAARQIDEERGVFRDSQGNVLR
jgi:hypothetical protein